ILINQRKITFTKESFDDLADEVDLQVLFVTANIEAYINEPDMLVLDDDFLDNLLEADLPMRRRRR
uniref:hypothetical protein n=1 Tax=Stenotrophomonas maltophilia TaxID=40324 RepID=UPI0013DCE0A6